MTSHQQSKKGFPFFMVLLSLVFNVSYSQSWNITGNANIASATQYLGTKDPNDLVFRTNAIERGRVFGAGGVWRFGSATNYAKIDSLGRLTFSGQGKYLVGANKYVFQYATTPNYGLFFNTAPLQYEFRNSAATPVFTINATTGAGAFTGTLKVGTYTLPATDGTNGQVLITNGSGTASWGNTNTNFWSLNGNAGTLPGSTSFLGTTDAKGLVFRTNNIERMRITNTGNIGIGTNLPIGALNVIGTSYATLTTPGYVQLGDSTGQNLGMDNEGIQARSSGAASVLFLNTYGGVTQIGNSSSSYQGILAAGSSYGAYAYAPGGTGVYGLGGIYGGYFENFNGIGVYGIDDGNGQGVLGYESGNGEGVNGQAYGTNGWGVRGYSQQSYGVYGYTANSGSYAGYFNGNVYTTGTYQPSDEKLKQNIQDFTSAMTIIGQLHPKQYQYRQDGSYKKMNLPQGQRYGLIAQELEKVLPGLVKKTTFDVDKAASPSKPNPKDPNAQAKNEAKKTGEAIDFKAINYTELIPIMIKGMQEQQQTINAQQEMMDKQQQQITELKTMVLSLTQGIVSSSGTGSSAIIGKPTLSGAVLEQNVPNPLTNSTSVRYYIPAGAGTSSLLVKDMNGKTIKQVNLQTGTGNITIDASTLSAGAYSYTLLIDGKTIATKKMIVAR